MQMKHNTVSIRPFLGAKNFEQSRSFYRHMGFEEVVIAPKLSLFKTGMLAFYLQDAYVRDWIDNTMVFLEVENLTTFWDDLQALNLTDTYPDVRLSPIRVEHWGREGFVHDPSGILWHIGEFF